MTRSRPLNHWAPCCGARPTTHKYSSSSSVSAFFETSTRYAMLAAQPIEHLPCGLRATSFHIGQPALNPLDRLDAVEQSLVGLRVLHDELRFPVDGQDQGMAGLPKTIEQLDRVAFEVAERPN